jgi:Flp pilus assembly pilin Flp
LLSGKVAFVVAFKRLRKTSLRSLLTRHSNKLEKWGGIAPPETVREMAELKGHLERLDSKGQTVIEYVLVLVIIVLVLLAAFRYANIGDAVNSQGGAIQNHLIDAE